MKVNKIVTHLWFDQDAEEAMRYYVNVFKESPSGEGNDSDIISISRYPSGYEEGPMANMEGKVLHGSFKLAGQEFMALDGGPIFKFNESISLYVRCIDQEEIDYFWERLSANAESEQCGWLKDKFGLSWQIIPNNMEDLMQSKEQVDAMLKMKKIDIEELRSAGNKFP